MQEIDLGQVSHQGNQALKSLHLDQPARRGEVGPIELTRRFLLDPSWTSPPAGNREADTSGTCAPTPRRRCSSRAWRLGKTSASRWRRPRSIAPVARQTCGGRCPFREQLTQVGALAGPLVVLPEQVHRADQPVLMRRHDPRGATIGPQPQDPRAAHQRDVVKMDDVGLGIIEDRLAVRRT